MMPTKVMIKKFQSKQDLACHKPRQVSHPQQLSHQWFYFRRRGGATFAGFCAQIFRQEKVVLQKLYYIKNYLNIYKMNIISSIFALKERYFQALRKHLETAHQPPKHALCDNCENFFHVCAIQRHKQKCTETYQKSEKLNNC